MLLDFPGLNDSQDSEDKFFGFIETNKDLPHVFMFITGIESAFNHGSELKYFERVLEIVKKQNNEGIYAEIIVVVNKYDEEYDEEYEDILADLPDVVASNAKIFRISSHRLLCQHIKLSSGPFHVPETYKREFSRIIRNSGAIYGKDRQVRFTGKFDANNLLGYINDVNVHGEEYKHMFRSLCEYNCTLDDCAKLDKKLAKLYELNPQFGDEPGFVSWITDMMAKLSTNIKYTTVRKFLVRVCDNPQLDSVVRGLGHDTMRLIVESIINRKGRKIDPDTLTRIILNRYDAYVSPMEMEDGCEMKVTHILRECKKCSKYASIEIKGRFYCRREYTSLYSANCNVCSKRGERGTMHGICTSYEYICDTCSAKCRIMEWSILSLDTILAFRDNPDDAPLKRLKSLIRLSRTSVQDIVTIHAVDPDFFTGLFPGPVCKDFITKTMELYHENKLSTHGSWLFNIKPTSRINDITNLILGKDIY